jgi:Skp family chaperone for outer membrane proteins
MKTLTTLLALALLSASLSRAQDEATEQRRPKRAATVQRALVGLSSEQTRRVFAPADKLTAELSESVKKIQDCLDAGTYLSKDLAATQRRLKPKNGQQIPTNQASLLVIKQSRLSRQRIACVSKMKSLDVGFDAAMQTLAAIEPRGLPGIKTRLDNVKAMRVQYDSVYRKLSGKLSGKAAPDPDRSEDADAAP